MLVKFSCFIEERDVISCRFSCRTLPQCIWRVLSDEYAQLVLIIWKLIKRLLSPLPRSTNLTIRSITDSDTIIPDPTPISDLIISDHTKNLTKNRSLWFLISRQAIRCIYGPTVRSCMAIYDSYNKINMDFLQFHIKTSSSLILSNIIKPT
jgi:hypothetical protein